MKKWAKRLLLVLLISLMLISSGQANTSGTYNHEQEQCPCCKIGLLTSRAIVTDTAGTRYHYKCDSGCCYECYYLDDKGDPVVTRQCTGGTATCVEQAECTTCRKKYGETDPNNHDWGVSPVKKDNSTHYWKCQREGCGATKDEAAHSFVYLYVDSASHSIYCSEKCGLEIFESHSWGIKSDGDYHWEECACGAVANKSPHTLEKMTDADYHWYACFCGTVRNKEAHDWGKMTDADYHWEECFCGAVRNKAAHTPGDAVKENEVAAGIGTAGSYDEVVYCTVCGREISRKSVATDPLPEPVKEYTITFKDDDGTVLETGTWKAGDMPMYLGMAPATKENVYYKSFFIGWDPAVSAVVGNAEYTAVYKQDYKYYTVTFVTLDASGGNQVSAYEKVRAGKTVNEPAKPTDVTIYTHHKNEIYPFSHWNEATTGSIAIKYDFSLPITHDITLNAIYKDGSGYLYTIGEIKRMSGGCYIATCVYGSYDAPEVWVLRRYRDNVLAKSTPGQAFIRAYYAVSPRLVEWFGDQQWFKGLFRSVLDPFVTKLKTEGFEDTPYDDP